MWQQLPESAQEYNLTFRISLWYSILHNYIFPEEGSTKWLQNYHKSFTKSYLALSLRSDGSSVWCAAESSNACSARSEHYFYHVTFQ